MAFLPTIREALGIKSDKKDITVKEFSIILDSLPKEMIDWDFVKLLDTEMFAYGRKISLSDVRNSIELFDYDLNGGITDEESIIRFKEIVRKTKIDQILTEL